MVYFKLLLNDKRQKADNIYPVVVRVTHNRNNTTFNTGIRVKSNHWDASSLTVKSINPNSQAFNKTISDFNSKIQKIAYQLINEEDFSFERLKECLNESNPLPKPKYSAGFTEYADQLIHELFEIHKSGNAIIYRTAANRLTNYAGKPNLKFTDIDYSLLNGFKQQLVKDGVKQNTISNYFRTLRAIYNKAIKAKLVDRLHYPFLEIPVKTERTAKRAITFDDLRAIAQADLKLESTLWHARNYFFISFSLIGASFVDLAHLTPGNIKKGRLIYKRKKTGQELSIKIQPYTLQLINYYAGKSSHHLLPILPADAIAGSLHSKRTIMQWIKTTNKWLNRIVQLCQLDADVTTYVARHSWATCAKKLGYSIELIAEALGHEYGNKITNIYLDRFDPMLIDQANDRLILSIVPCVKEVANPYKYVLKPSMIGRDILLGVKYHQRSVKAMRAA